MSPQYRKGLNGYFPARLTLRQKSCRAFLAPSTLPLAHPEASTAALIAPALVPLIARMSSLGSSNRRSSTPQVKAPWEPPPCKANVMGFRVDGSLIGFSSWASSARLMSCDSRRAISCRYGLTRARQTPAPVPVRAASIAPPCRGNRMDLHWFRRGSRHTLPARSQGWPG